MFDVLNKYEPVLLNVRDHSEKQWNEVFGSEYSNLSEDRKSALVVLVECDGGIYRLKNIDHVFDD